MSIRSSRMLATVVAAVALVASVAAVADARSEADIYSVHQLVGDTATTGAPAVDASLVNGWGLSAGPTTPWWTSNNGSNTSTLYSGTGAKAALTVAVPGGPTGTVFNGARSDFAVSQNGKSGAARFLFATEGGTILGWSPTVNGTAAISGADRSATGAVYKGLAIANDRLYATDFHNGRVDVFDASFDLVTPRAASRPQDAEGLCAVRDPGARRQHLRHLCEAGRRREGRHAATGPGVRGRVHAGRPLVARVVNSGKKNAPLNAAWGLALAPADFERLRRRSPRRELRQRPHQRVHEARQQMGLQGPAPPCRRHADRDRRTLGDRVRQRRRRRTTNTLYFLAGPGEEAHGLFGSITAG